MKRALRLAMRLYPRAWRERYGPEFTAVLEQAGPGWANLFDVLKGGFRMRLSSWTPALAVAGFALCGALLGYAASFALQSTYVSTTVLLIRAPKGGDPGNVQLSETVNRMARQALTRNALAEIIQTRNLYEKHRQRLPIEDVIETMRRHDIRISSVVSFSTGSQKPPAFQLSFAASDGSTAQMVTRDITARLLEAQKTVAPDATLEIIDPANRPLKPAFPSRRTVAMLGLLAGTAAGLLYVWLNRFRHPLTLQ